MQNSIEVPRKIGSGCFGVVWFVFSFKLILFLIYSGKTIEKCYIIFKTLFFCIYKVTYSRFHLKIRFFLTINRLVYMIFTGKLKIQETITT